MNLMKCSNGHFYDGDKYASCPHCGSQAPSTDSVTISLPVGGSEEKTVALGAGSGMEESVTIAQYSTDHEPVTQKSVHQAPPELNLGASAGIQGMMEGFEDLEGAGLAEDDNNMTVSYYSQKISQKIKIEPVVGWLVCTAGEYFGQSFCLKSGRNFIGRSSQMDVCLEGEKSVSRERHAVIIYEPRGRVFIAQPGDSRELFYVNDNVVLDNLVLKPNDVISLGKVNLMIIPCCNEQFAWEDLEEAEKENTKSEEK
ncbi:MAG: FHA domain-containing protein [Lachnospiraceae bacterium]|jgi:hypothetical protein|nr:FHA domain-containing protein [Lachnospiraceae bacterium]